MAGVRPNSFFIRTGVSIPITSIAASVLLENSRARLYPLSPTSNGEGPVMSAAAIQNEIRLKIGLVPAQ